jgi:hypothetical protein
MVTLRANNIVPGVRIQKSDFLLEPPRERDVITVANGNITPPRMFEAMVPGLSAATVFHEISADPGVFPRILSNYLRGLILASVVDND